MFQFYSVTVGSNACWNSSSAWVWKRSFAILPASICIRFNVNHVTCRICRFKTCRCFGFHIAFMQTLELRLLGYVCAGAFWNLTAVIEYPLSIFVLFWHPLHHTAIMRGYRGRSIKVIQYAKSIVEMTEVVMFSNKVTNSVTFRAQNVFDVRVLI